ADAAHHAEVHAAGHGREGEFAGPTLDDHLPAVGLGKPINRTLWTLIWAVCSVLFQGMGINYILGGSLILPLFMREMVDYVSGPTTFFIAATLAFAALVAFRRTFANGVLAWAIVSALLLFFGLSMTDWDFRDIVTKPDNVPIVGMIIVVGFFTWVG